MQNDFLDQLYLAHQQCSNCPPRKEIAGFYESLLELLFPNFNSNPLDSPDDLKVRFDVLQDLLKKLIGDQENNAEKTEAFFNSLPKIYHLLQEDVDAIYAGDPAAESRAEVIRSYPGFYAIAAYRIAHEMLKLQIGVLPRSITEHAHSKTGIDIHPAATIGRRFCIDHGTGIVIGASTEIGDDVKIYQGVTLGALSVEKELSNTKRHPTIGNKVVIYSGATILGGTTTLGDESIIGGNVWLTKSVPSRSKVYYQQEVAQTNGLDQSERIKIKGI